MRQEGPRTFKASMWPTSNVCAGSCHAFTRPESPNTTLRVTKWAPLAVVCCLRCTILVQGEREWIRSTEVSEVSNRDAVCKYAVVFIAFNTQDASMATRGVDGCDCRKVSRFSAGHLFDT
ncbi:hypothetical protein MRX96_041576 [Rhipicephalus microplus]